MSQIRVAVHGALGKMGQEVLRAVCHDVDLQAVGAVDIRAQGDALPLPDGIGSIPLSADLDSIITSSSPDVLVDFSTASATMPAVRTAVGRGVRMVIGTTGLSQADQDEIRELCASRGVGAVVAANFSLAAAIMVHACRTAARFFDYADIIEMHHEQKLDAPSGTALATARAMVDSRGGAFSYPKGSGGEMATSRGSEYEGIALHSVRMPGLLAHQQVILGAPGQTLTVRLDQISREAFMPSVVLASKRVMELKEAVFGLERILGLQEEQC